MYYRASLDRLARVYGPRHPARLHPLRDLAFLLFAEGRLDEAEARAAEAVTVARATRPGGSSIAQTLSVYSMILRRQGKLDEAEAIARESAALPARRPADRAVPLGTLASVLLEKGDLTEAERAQREVLDLLAAAHGADSPQAAYAAVKLARILQQRGRFAEAERLLLEAHAAPEGTAHHGGNRAREALVELYEAWGRPADADRYRSSDAEPVSG
jgi:ATP/maltotriose-dependent transcriptional regulator MalT